MDTRAITYLLLFLPVG